MTIPSIYFNKKRIRCRCKDIYTSDRFTERFTCYFCHRRSIRCLDCTADDRFSIINENYLLDFCSERCRIAYEIIPIND